MNQFDTLKCDTCESKLPKELTEGATESKITADKWFKENQAKTKPADNTKGTRQTKLGEEE